MAIYRRNRREGIGGAHILAMWCHLFFCVVPHATSRKRGGRNVCEVGRQGVLQFRLVPHSELEQRIRAAEDELLADIIAVIFDCAIVDEQFRGD